MQRCSFLFVACLSFVFCANSATAQDLFLVDGDASVNLDTDATNDTSFDRIGFPSVLENLDFRLRTDFEGTTSVFSLGSGLTISSVNTTGPNAGQIVFDSILVPGSTTPSPGSDVLLPVLNFNLVEEANGDASLYYTVNLAGINFTTNATQDVTIDAFLLFDYSSDNPTGETAGVSSISAYTGEAFIGGDSSGSSLVVFEGDSIALEIGTLASLDSQITSGTDFNNQIGMGDDLVAGLQFQSVHSVPGTGSTSFTDNHSGRIVAVPEPGIYAAVLGLMLGFLAFDARKRSRRKQSGK